MDEDDAVLLSDILPTAWHANELAKARRARLSLRQLPAPPRGRGLVPDLLYLLILTCAGAQGRPRGHLGGWAR